MEGTCKLPAYFPISDESRSSHDDENTQAEIKLFCELCLRFGQTELISHLENLEDHAAKVAFARQLTETELERCAQLLNLHQRKELCQPFVESELSAMLDRIIAPPASASDKDYTKQLGLEQVAQGKGKITLIKWHV